MNIATVMPLNPTKTLARPWEREVDKLNKIERYLNKGVFGNMSGDLILDVSGISKFKNTSLLTNKTIKENMLRDSVEIGEFEGNNNPMDFQSENDWLKTQTKNDFLKDIELEQNSPFYPSNEEVVVKTMGLLEEFLEDKLFVK